MENSFVKKNPLQDLLSSLNVVISTNKSTRFLTAHVIDKPAYTYKFQLKTTKVDRLHMLIYEIVGIKISSINLFALLYLICTVYPPLRAYSSLAMRTVVVRRKIVDIWV